MRVSCGVVVTDGERLLLGHATGSPRWDIFKGVAEPGEPHALAASRELHEETGLRVSLEALIPLGRHAYLPQKMLVLFAWYPAPLPNPANLRCTSIIDRPGRAGLPELDRFGLFTPDQAYAVVGRNLARVLKAVWPSLATSLPARDSA